MVVAFKLTSSSFTPEVFPDLVHKFEDRKTVHSPKIAVCPKLIVLQNRLNPELADQINQFFCYAKQSGRIFNRSNGDSRHSDNTSVSWAAIDDDLGK